MSKNRYLPDIGFKEEFGWHIPSGPAIPPREPNNELWPGNTFSRRSTVNSGTGGGGGFEYCPSIPIRKKKSVQEE